MGVANEVTWPICFWAVKQQNLNAFLSFFFFKISLDVDHFFLSFFLICYNIPSVLCFGFLASRHVGS